MGSSTRSSSSFGSSQNSSGATRSSAPSSSATDAALARKVGQGGTPFGSRSEAVSDFQQKYAKTYTSTYSSEPSTRPSHIPDYTTVGGNSYHITYNSNYGGYGYWQGGRWTMYDALRDAVMVNALMGQHNYYYGGGGGYGYGNGYGYNDGPYNNQSTGGGLFVGFLFMLILIIAAVVVFNFLRSRGSVRANPLGVVAAGGIPSSSATPPPLRNLHTSPMDKSKPADWLAVKPNSVITVSDTQGIQDSMKRGLGVKGIDYTVRTIARMKQLDGLSTHLLFTLNDDQQVTYLLVKMVDDLIDLGLYFEVPGLEPGSRQDLINRGALWLFQEPANPQNYQPSDLRYTTSIKQTVPKTGGGEEEVFYALKAQGELQCEYHETPTRSGMTDDSLATLVEYKTDQPVENPEFLILEVGAQRGSTSYVQFYLGCPIKFSEVDVLPV